MPRGSDSGVASLLGPALSLTSRRMFRFYEGVLTVGYTTDASDAAVQANIVAAGYGR
jgi:hypothetical protein